MMRSLTTGVLGIGVHQTQMDVISNNIANVNTYGFKKSRTLFKDILSQTLTNAQGPTANHGGINGMQIGLGVKIGSIDNVFTSGAVQATGRDLDLSIEGDGFFMTSNGLEKFYTKSGTFDLDSSLNLIHSGSATKILGWNAKEDPINHTMSIDTTSPVQGINFNNFQKMPATATTFIEYASNLQSTSAERSLVEEKLMVFSDDQGKQQNLKFRFTKIDKNNWSWTAYSDTVGQVGTGKLTFDENGKIVGSTGGPNLTFDPDGVGGAPPELSLQANNTAGIDSADFIPLTPEIWGMTVPLAVNGQAVSTDSLTLGDLYDVTNADPAQRFDLRGLSGDETLIFSGTDGNGQVIDSKSVSVSRTTKISDLVTSLKSVFPNSIPAFDAQTGKITLTAAMAGTKSPNGNIKVNFVNPDNAVNPATFPGVATTTSPTVAAAGGFNEIKAAVGTVKTGIHSLTVSKVASTAANVTGLVTGLSRYTSFADLDIGDANSLQISIDRQPAVKVTGLSAGTYAQISATNTVANPPVGGYTGGNMTVNGYVVSWTTAEVGGLTRNQYGNFIANRINSTFRTIYQNDSSNPNTVYASFDAATNKISMSQMHRGGKYNISVTNANAATGFDLQPVAYGSDGSRISDLIDAINSQVTGVTAEMLGDKLVVKRSFTGATYNVNIMSTTPGSVFTSYTGAPADPINNPPSAMGVSTRNINDAIFGTPTPPATAGTDETYNLTDVFTPSGGGASTELKYNDIRDGQVIGDATIGKMILKIPTLQVGNAVITTTSEHNAGLVNIGVPQNNSYNVNFALKSGGTAISDISVQMLKGAEHVAATQIYDSVGSLHKLNMKFEKVEPNKWQYNATLDVSDPLIQDYFKRNPISGTEPSDIELNSANDAVMGFRTGTLIFDKYGKIDKSATASANSVPLPEYVNAISFTPVSAAKVEFKPNFALVTQFDSAFSTAAKSQDGYSMGILNGLSVDQNGITRGSYTNGQKLAIGQIATAKFANNQGLDKRTDGLYVDSLNSGMPIIGTPDSGGRGKIAGQTLEMSNVDITKEFTDMITSQRGFQANAKTITTADTLLQEILNLKR